MTFAPRLRPTLFNHKAMERQVHAEALVTAIERGTDECYVGKSRLLRLVMRVAPGVGYRILKCE